MRKNIDSRRAAEFRPTLTALCDKVGNPVSMMTLAGYALTVQPLQVCASGVVVELAINVIFLLQSTSVFRAPEGLCKHSVADYFSDVACTAREMAFSYDIGLKLRSLLKDMLTLAAALTYEPAAPKTPRYPIINPAVKAWQEALTAIGAGPVRYKGLLKGEGANLATWRANVCRVWPGADAIFAEAEKTIKLTVLANRWYHQFYKGKWHGQLSEDRARDLGFQASIFTPIGNKK